MLQRRNFGNLRQNNQGKRTVQWHIVPVRLCTTCIFVNNMIADIKCMLSKKSIFLLYKIKTNSSGCVFNM